MAIPPHSMSTEPKMKLLRLVAKDLEDIENNLTYEEKAEVFLQAFGEMAANKKEAPIRIIETSQGRIKIFKAGIK